MVSNPHLSPFTDFLKQQKDYKTINLDQWQGFGRFTQEVGRTSNSEAVYISMHVRTLQLLSPERHRIDHLVYTLTPNR